MPNVEVAIGTSPDLVKNIPLDMVFDYLGIAIDSSKAEGRTITIKLEVDGSTEKHSLTLRNSVVNASVSHPPNPDLTLKGTGPALNALLMGGDAAAVPASGAVTATGRTAVLTELLGLVAKFPYWFPIVTRPTPT